MNTISAALTFVLFFSAAAFSQNQGSSQIKYFRDGRSIIFSNGNKQIRLTPYGNNIIRVQTIRSTEQFFSDDRNEMVVTHQWTGELNLSENEKSYQLSTPTDNGISISMDKPYLQLSFSKTGTDNPFLEQEKGIWWSSDTAAVFFRYDPKEHFTGLGHGYYGREESLDLRGKIINRNYGTEHGQQAPLIVPMYLSGKGYGVFLNSTFPNTFNFGKDGNYSFSVSGNGQMDFFVMSGPDFVGILDLYTQLTGRPRFPPKAFFGLALSDKGNDHTSTDPSDENWWKRKISDHRNAGFPLDHIVNDNRWRAGGGQRCLSFFEWDLLRFPDPSEYGKWVKSNGLIMTLDFNRCIASHSEGWKPGFNIPQSDKIDFGDSAPDFTKKEVRDWFWNLMWKKSLDPKLTYPGDALWIDEFDEMGQTPPAMKFENGTSWLEMRNYWFFLISKSLVEDGWDKSFAGSKRSFVWVRGMTAGAQRFATLWSGDIKPTYSDMKTQVRSLQLSGLSGFPFWGHDAGGFYNWETKEGPDDDMYRNWSMAFGSFTSFWKPHGVGKSRWPLDRSSDVQKDAMLYSHLRYQLLPYLYSYANQASTTGLPVSRAMVIGRELDSLAWKSDLQYMWGNEFLVAPNCSDSDHVKVWLPEGNWYDFWNEEILAGNRTFDYASPTGKLPLFVKSGSIIPMYNFALSTAFMHEDSLTLHVYTGKDSHFELYEDDGVSENWKTKKEKRTTDISFRQSEFELNISASEGNYLNAPVNRFYIIIFHGLSKPVELEVNGKKLEFIWNQELKTLTVAINTMPVSQKLVIRKSMN